jgi:hypothetical protein
MSKSILFLISGWLAVPYKEYQKLYIDAGYDGFNYTEDEFYSAAKFLADKRNDLKYKDVVFKNKFKKKYYPPLIDFIQLYYDIRKQYSKTFLEDK